MGSGSSSFRAYSKARARPRPMCRAQSSLSTVAIINVSSVQPQMSFNFVLLRAFADFWTAVFRQNSRYRIQHSSQTRRILANLARVLTVNMIKSMQDTALDIRSVTVHSIISVSALTCKFAANRFQSESRSHVKQIFIFSSPTLSHLTESSRGRVCWVRSLQDNDDEIWTNGDDNLRGRCST